MRLIYETHSTSSDNEIGVASGHNDPDLSATGERQAAELGERRVVDDIAIVYCSDSLRARRTAEIAFGVGDIPIITDARLRECNYGDMNGHAAEQVRAVRARHVTQPFPDGESYTDVVRRVSLFLDEASRRHGAETVLVIAHRAPQHAFEHLLNGRDLADVVAGDWEWQPGWVYEVRS